MTLYSVVSQTKVAQYSIRVSSRCSRFCAIRTSGSRPCSANMAPLESETATMQYPDLRARLTKWEPALPIPGPRCGGSWPPGCGVLPICPGQTMPLSGRGLPAERASEVDRLAGNDPGDFFTHDFVILIGHPSHDRGIGIHIRCGDVTSWSDHVGDGTNVAS